MPAVSHGEGSTQAHSSRSKNVEVGISFTPQVSHQPSPAPVAAEHNQAPHVLHRRFIGPMPEVHANSAVAEEKKRRFKALRRGAMRKLKGEAKGDDGGFLGEEKDIEYRRRVMKLLRRKRRKPEDEDGSESSDDLSDYEDDEEDQESERRERRLAKSKSKGKSKGKQKRKDVWIGESFDIGQEFKTDKSPTSTGTATPTPSSGRSTITDEPEAYGEPNGDNGSAHGSSTSQRPPNSTRTTQESFVTARTQFSNSFKESDEIPGQAVTMLDVPTQPRTGGSVISANGDDETNGKRQSGSSSMRPLMGSTSASPHPSPKGKGKSRPDLGHDHGKLGKLKSAMRKSSTRDHTRAASEIVRNGSLKQARFAELSGSSESASPEGTRDALRSKSVQFPIDPVEVPPPLKEPTRRGNKAPADPIKVLQREGDAAEGTSAGAVEEALGEEEDESEEDEAFLPGHVVMRGRMLVKVGYHRDDGLGPFNESVQRRSPCSRMEAFEEYVVAWRKGRVEFYQEWSNPITSRIHGGTLRLCFIVPLLPNRTTLCVFNETDLSLCLTTSAGRLQADLQRGLRSYSTHSRSTTYKNRVQQSKQAKWLRTGRRGTHVFILKAHHRSSAIDWFWELWRDLGGELPEHFDVSIPSFGSTVRIAIPQGEEDDMVGSRRVCAAMSPEKTIRQCVDMTGQVLDLDQLLADRRKEGLEGFPQLELVWKCQEGTLEWVTDKTTLLGQRRDWGILAGVALAGVESFPRKLQMRGAKHQSHTLRLEDGTKLSEPPAVEGYITRLSRGNSSSRAELYITTHDGHIIISKSVAAQPPIKPGPEGSTPLDLFSEVYDEFHLSEMARLTSVVELSDAIIDFRSIESIKLEETPESAAENEHEDRVDHTSSDPPGESTQTVAPTRENRHRRRILVSLDKGEPVTLEARSRAIAEEWVTRLNDLAEYWKVRQRVDARIRMDVVKMHSSHNALAELSNDSDTLLGDVWNWCVLQGCRTVTLSGRLFMKKGRLEKFRAKFMVLAGGGLVTFKIKSKNPSFQRKRHYTLFGAYVYSGMLAQEELHEGNTETLNGGRARVYQDGLQTSDGAEDTTFVVRLAYPRTVTWTKDTDPWKTELVPSAKTSFTAPGLSTKAPGILIFRARSKLERDRWVWAINAEMERQTRDHVDCERAMREVGKLP